MGKIKKKLKKLIKKKKKKEEEEEDDVVHKLQTNAMMISRAAPLDPPIMETIRLGVMAMPLVIRFLIHFFILRSKKPYKSHTILKLIKI